MSCKHITAVRHAKNGSLGNSAKHRKTAIPDFIVLSPILGNFKFSIIKPPISLDIITKKFVDFTSY